MLYVFAVCVYGRTQGVRLYTCVWLEVRINRGVHVGVYGQEETPISDPLSSRHRSLHWFGSKQMALGLYMAHLVIVITNLGARYWSLMTKVLCVIPSLPHLLKLNEDRKIPS